MKRSSRWLILGGCLVVLLCLGTAALLTLRLFNTTPFTIGPTFTTPESLAYDVVYETAGADPDSIIHLQTQSAGQIHAVLTRYEVNGEPNVRLLLARDDGREFFVENMTAGRSTSNQDLTATAEVHTDAAASESAIYGRLLNPAISRVVITWAAGNQLDATISQDAYLHFQSWSLADGSPEPASITAYDAAGNVMSELTFSP